MNSKSLSVHLKQTSLGKQYKILTYFLFNQNGSVVCGTSIREKHLYKR